MSGRGERESRKDADLLLQELPVALHYLDVFRTV